ncbi:type i polyketide synthase, partial [Nannochloropsis gaditana CCMP526]|uniref:type i polyketide synthase n=1 Tax=Nannochloropsis gaditana (strain CCMP526) TaxID=1093141 RepID=UPI00029F65E3
RASPAFRLWRKLWHLQSVHIARQQGRHPPSQHESIHVRRRTTLRNGPRLPLSSKIYSAKRLRPQKTNFWASPP